MHTPDVHAIRRLLRRHRVLLVCASGGALIAGVVAANQPHGDGAAGGPSPVHAVAAAPRPPAGHHGAAAEPGLRVLREPIAFSDHAGQHPGAPGFSASAGVLVDADTASVLWEHDPHLARAPASTIKVLSGLVAMENLPFDRVITVTPDALTQAGDETTMGLVAGQRLTVRELLTGMLTVSANDAATALAVDTVGIPRFVAAMNDQIRALGLHDSRVGSPVGLDDPSTTLSAYDLAAIAYADVEHFDVFSQIVSQRDIVLAATDGHPAFDLPNLNRLLEIYPPAVGIKPGWTGAAGPCLVAMAVRNGHRLIAVLLGDAHLYNDARILLDWGFVQEGLPSQLPTPAPSPSPGRTAPAKPHP